MQYFQLKGQLLERGEGKERGQVQQNRVIGNGKAGTAEKAQNLTLAEDSCKIPSTYMEAPS